MDGLAHILGRGHLRGLRLRFMDDGPAVRRRHPLGQGRDAAEPGPADVDDVLHALCGQIPLADGPGVVEGNVPAGSQAGGLHHGHLMDAGGQPLGQQGHIVLDALGEHPFLHPHAGKDMALGGDQQGVQTHRFQAGGVQQGQVQAGAQLLPQHRVAQPHPLTHLLEAGGRHRVGDILLLQGGENGRRLAHHPVGVLGLVGVHGGVSGPLAQKFRGPGNDPGHAGMIGGDEGRQQLRVQAQAVPLVEGQHGGLGMVLHQDFPAPADLKTEQAGCLLRHARQVGAIQQQLGPGDLQGPARGQAVDVAGEFQGEFRHGGDPQIQMLQIRAGAVGEDHGADRHHAVLLQGIVDHRQHIYLQLHGAGGAVCGCDLRIGCHGSSPRRRRAPQKVNNNVIVPRNPGSRNTPRAEKGLLSQRGSSPVG